MNKKTQCMINYKNLHPYSWKQKLERTNQKISQISWANKLRFKSLWGQNIHYQSEIAKTPRKQILDSILLTQSLEYLTKTDVQGTSFPKQSISKGFSNKQISSKSQFSFWYVISECWALQNNKPKWFPTNIECYSHPQSLDKILSSNLIDFWLR